MNVSETKKTAGDLMIPSVVTVSRDTNVHILARHLLTGQFSGLPVVEEAGEVVGMVTEFDVLRALLEEKDLYLLKAEEIMSAPPVCVTEETPMASILQKMIEHRIIRIPVVRDRKLVGIISRATLLSRLVERTDSLTHALSLCYWCEQVLDDHEAASGKVEWCELQEYLRRYDMTVAEVSFSPRFCSICGPKVKHLLGVQ